MIPLDQTHDLIKLMAEIAQLKEEVERLRTREVALVAALERALRLAQPPPIWGAPYNAFDRLFMIVDDIEKALAADSSAPATEGRP